MELSPLYERIKDYQHRTDLIANYLDIDVKAERLVEVERELENPNIWNHPDQAQALGKERAHLHDVVNTVHKLRSNLEAIEELVELSAAEEAWEDIEALLPDVADCETQLDKLEFQRMFNHEMDANHAYLDIQAGSGGTEAQDWANMLLRMYLRWAEKQGFETELMEVSAGEVAGIKSATIHIKGDHAYGWTRTELGVHRLVRKSPFDSGARRHTSFASVFVAPEVDDSFEIDINPADLRVDVYRASGAGGQHVNKTESAVRITHLPTNTVVQCQNGRSQHQNKAEAMKQLKARLYEQELLSRNAEKQQLEDAKSDIGWGSQIRSYVLDSGRIKDLRTGVETSNTGAVLDGDLNSFIIESLKAGV